MRTMRTLEISDVLNGWEDFGIPVLQPAEVVHRLEGGRSNRSYLIAAGAERFVVRLDGRQRFGVLREREYVITRAAAATGLAAPLLYANSDLGVAISAYIEPSAQAPALQALVERLKLVHQLPHVQPAIDYSEHYKQYWLAAGKPGNFEEFRLQIDGVTDSEPAGICHHDPGPANTTVAAGQVVFIDWEYAAWGCPIFDFAVLVADWSFSLTAVAECANIDPVKLTSAVALYRQLTHWWQATEAGVGTP